MNYTQSQIDSTETLDCTYGSHYTSDLVHALHMDDGTTIYTVDDSVNVNQCSTEDFHAAQEDGRTIHVDDLTDLDGCSAQDPITALDQLAELICEEEEDEQTEAEAMEQVIESIHNGQHAQARNQWNACKATHDTTPAELFEYAGHYSSDTARKTLSLFN